MTRFARLNLVVDAAPDDREYHCPETDILDEMLVGLEHDHRRGMLLALRVDALEPPGPDRGWLEWEAHGQTTQLDELVARYEAGATFAALADWAGISRPAMRFLLVDAGVTPRRRGAPRKLPSTDEILDRILLARQRPERIGAEFGVTTAAVYMQLRYAGLRMLHGLPVLDDHHDAIVQRLKEAA